MITTQPTLDAPGDMPGFATPSFATMRHAMVASQLRPNAVSDMRVVAAMAKVPRENFLVAGLRRLAYRDTAVGLSGTRAMNPPVATGRLLTEALLTDRDRVLLIGAAAGYAAAVLSLLVGDVTAVESEPTLAAAARNALVPYPHVELVVAPLADGAAAGAPYDVLVIDGAVEAVPEALLAQLRPGARIATGLVERGVTRLAAGTKSAGGFGLVAFADVECVRLPGFAAPKSFSF